MARIRLPKRPDPVRIQQARVAAARVGTASAQKAVSEEIEVVAGDIPADYAETVAAINARLEDIEAQLP